MSGVWVLGELLTAAAPLQAVVGDNIRGGAFGQGEGVPPGVAINTISGVEAKMLSQGSRRRVAERVQATCFGRNYEEAKTIVQLVRAAGAGAIGDFADVADVSVVLDGTGPDFVTENPTIWCSTQDFIVSYNELT